MSGKCAVYNVTMNDHSIIRSLALLLLLVITLATFGKSFFGLGLYPASVFQAANSADDTLLTVAFLDVGQGDAIFIETPDGVQVLIDGGRDASVLRGLGEVMSWGDRTLDLVIATHPDLDHIGGLPDVLDRFVVSTIMLTTNEADSTAADVFREAITAESAEVFIASAGSEYALGASTTLTIYSPVGDPRNWESNNSSIVAKLSYGESDFMLTGDASKEIESYLARTYGGPLDSEVLKLGHHGSKTSTGAEFLAMVTPIYAVVSAGKDNSYGHPHAEVVERTLTAGAQILNTADVGTIVFKSDGIRVWVE